MASSEHNLTRDIPATVIPAGDSVTLTKGTSAYVMQTLGGSVTVRTDGGLFRITREHADALKEFDVSTLGGDDEAAATGEFSEEAVWNAMKTCFDPEIPVNIVDLGLVYDLSVEKTATGGHALEVKMTLTAPGCGMGPVIAEDARKKIAALPTVESAKVHIVWDPQWSPQMISDAGRKALGLE
jgi:probable FeS assembly SUF system protein SufT